MIGTASGNDQPTVGQLKGGDEDGDSVQPPYILDTATVPSNWREALITPLYKKGHRPVSSPVHINLILQPVKM